MLRTDYASMAAQWGEYVVANPIIQERLVALENAVLDATDVSMLEAQRERVLIIGPVQFIGAIMKLSPEAGLIRVVVCRQEKRVMRGETPETAEAVTKYLPLDPQLCRVAAELFGFHEREKINAVRLPEPNGAIVMHQPLDEGQRVEVIVGIPANALDQVRLGHIGFDPSKGSFQRRPCDKCGHPMWLELEQWKAGQEIKTAGHKVEWWCHGCAEPRMNPGNVAVVETLAGGAN